MLNETLDPEIEGKVTIDNVESCINYKFAVSCALENALWSDWSDEKIVLTKLNSKSWLNIITELLSFIFDNCKGLYMTYECPLATIITKPMIWHHCGLGAHEDQGSHIHNNFKMFILCY